MLIVASGGLGDAVLFSLVLPRLTRLANDGEQITLLVPASTAKMSFLFGPEVETLPVDYNRLANERPYRLEFKAKLKERCFRLVISTDYLRHPKRDELLIKACNAPECVAMYARPWTKYDRLLDKNRRLYTRLFESGPPLLDKVIRWTLFANWLTGEDLPPPLIRLPGAQWPAENTALRSTVILAPFSAVPEKQSSAKLWETILETLPPGDDIIVTGAPGDLAKNPAFQALLARSNVTYNDSSFESLAPHLRVAKLVISVDTATMHLSVALGALTLCLASAAYVNEIVPYAPEISPPNAHIIYTPMDCQSCLGQCVHAAENGMYPCVARINPGQVIRKIRALLGENAG